MSKLYHFLKLEYISKLKFSLILLVMVHAMPAIYFTQVYGIFSFGFFGALSLALSLQFMGPSRSLKRRALISLFSCFAGFASICLAISVYLQGTGFNEVYFFHFDAESFFIGFNEYPLVFASAFVYLTLCGIIPFFLKDHAVVKDLKPKVWVICLSIITLLCFPPIVSLALYGAETYAGKIDENRRVARQSRTLEVLPFEHQPKNLILIYAESLERIYFDDEVFPGVLPSLNALRKSSVDFSNLHQVRHTGWTIAGIVATQCSLPLNITYIQGEETQMGMAAVETPFQNEICFGDILKSYGYKNQFLGGAKLSFAGKGKFLKTHGFGQVYGFDELKQYMPNASHRSGWGLHDDTLLEVAQTKIDELKKTDEPYVLSLLTVDTHHPNGHVPKTCTPSNTQDNAILKALNCNDQVLSEFIERQINDVDLDNTVIALVSDHLSMRNTVFDTLKANNEKRRLTFLLWDKDSSAKENKSLATHFDVGPTLLDYLNIPNYRQNNWGRSIRDEKAGYWFSETTNRRDRKAAQRLSYIDSKDSNALEGITFNSEDMTIKVDQKKFQASYAGFDIADSTFMLLFNRKGDVDAIVFAKTKEEFNRIARDHLVAAVTFNPAMFDDAITDTAHTSDKLYYYLGYPSVKNGESGVINGEFFVSGTRVKKALKVPIRKKQ
ncbi:MAG: sulfatase-like hydrolase/transferase [Maricaulaceae bacterium]